MSHCHPANSNHACSNLVSDIETQVRSTEQCEYYVSSVIISGLSFVYRKAPVALDQVAITKSDDLARSMS